MSHPSDRPDVQPPEDHGTDRSVSDAGPPGGPEPSMQVYASVLSLVELVESLLVGSRRREWRMPLLCLIGPPGAPSPLDVIANLLTVPGRQVPHARLDAAQPDLASCLEKAHEDLTGERFGRSALHFRHYALVAWLLTVDLRAVPVDKRQRELARLLGRHRGLRPDGDPPTAAQALGGLPGLLLWTAVRLLPIALLRLLLTGRFGFGREFRWIVRQPFLSPEPSRNFLGFARRLTVGARDSEVPEQIDRLLVHAFLEDLRRAYRRRPWRLRTWQRTAYPVLLVDDACAGSAAYRLLAMVNAVRNETGEADPLLVMTNGPDVPPEGRDLSHPRATQRVVPLRDVNAAYRAWDRTAPAAARMRQDDAWYLRVLCPYADLRQFLGQLPQIAPRAVPVLARPMVLAALALTLVVGGGAWKAPALWHAYQAYRADCYPVQPTGRVNTTFTDGQCLGYSDSTSLLFSSDDRLTAIQRIIFGQNAEAVTAATARRTNPQITLVYLGSLTKPDSVGNEETFAAEREELQGIAAAQYRANNEARDSRSNPFVRILVANAGQEMEHAHEVVSMLARLKEKDRSVLGVIGLVESRTGTKEAIGDLGRARLPAIAPTLSADKIADASSFYLQISAPNVDEAALVFSHTTEVAKKQKLFNFYTYGAKGLEAKDSDLYVNTLRADLQESFGANYEESFWTEDVALGRVCADTSPDVAIFFGGRYSEFGAFARALANDCSGRLPYVVADDSVNRYMASRELREKTAPDNFPVAYVSKGSLAYCDRLHDAPDTERRHFRSDLEQVLGLCRTPRGAVEEVSPVGERVGLAYDAMRLFQRAVTTMASTTAGDIWDPSRLDPVGVHNQIKQMAGNSDPYHGVTGFIRFGQNGIVLGKRLSLLCAPNIKAAFTTPAHTPQEIDRRPRRVPAERPTPGPPGRRAPSGPWADPNEALDQEAKAYGEKPLQRRTCTSTPGR